MTSSPTGSASALSSRRVTLAAVVITVLSVVGFIVFAVTQLPEAANGGPDFPNYYVGGERLFAGQPVYGPLAPIIAERFGEVDYLGYPADPPITVALLAPLSLLPYRAAWILFVSLSALLLVGVGYVVGRRVGLSKSAAGAVGAFTLITSSGRLLLTTNHMEAVLLVLLVLGWLALRRGNDVGGGIWWGIAAALKLFPALLIVGLLAARRTRAALSAIATAALATGVGVAVVGWDDTVVFVRDVLPASHQWYGVLGNYSLLSFGTALFSEPVGWAMAAIGAVGLIWWYWRASKTIDQVWVGGIAAALLITPLSWLNYLVLIIPGVMLIAARLDLHTVSGRWTLVGLIGSLGFWGPIALADRVPSVLLSFVPMYGLVALFFLAMRAVRT